MEKFKACEKEMKTKAFSTIGLIQAAKLDPKEQEKEEEAQWLQGKVEELQMQIEQAEAEIEALQGTGKKGRKASAAAGRTEDLEHLNERRKWHVSRLEIVLRLLQNGSLSAEKCQSLHDDVSYFVESNQVCRRNPTENNSQRKQEEDFEEDEGIYDDLNLDEEEEKFGIPIGDDDPSTDSDEGSEGMYHFSVSQAAPQQHEAVVELPPRTPKKHDDEHVVKPLESPILKKANVTLQLRSQSILSSVVSSTDTGNAEHSIDCKLPHYSLVDPPPHLSYSETTTKSKFQRTIHVKRREIGTTNTKTGSNITSNTICSSGGSSSNASDRATSTGTVTIFFWNSTDSTSGNSDNCIPTNTFRFSTVRTNTIVTQCLNAFCDKPDAILSSVISARRLVLLRFGMACCIRGHS